MPTGRNRFSELYASALGKRITSPETCVFVSHSHLDKPVARDIAGALTEMGVDVYFDETDKALAIATGGNDDEKVVACIEAGLESCTHLLGVITERTKESWWVPYEIGGATGRQRECAHLITQEVKNLPAYIKIKKVLLDVDDLKKWLAASARQMTTFASKGASPGGIPTPPQLLRHVPAIRMPSDIAFTPVQRPATRFGPL